MKPSVSVIIPVYNAEKYLAQCLDSILSGQLEDFELLLIDDGSADSSGPLCDRYAAGDNRVKVVHVENGGVSRARNLGIEMAVAEYIAFVDADDWVDAAIYRDMADRIRVEQADIILCSYSIFDGVREQRVDFPWADDPVFGREDIKKKLLPAFMAPLNINGRKQEDIMGSVWRGLFKKELLTTTGITFDSRINRTQDLAFILQMLSKATKVGIINKPYYHYRQDMNNGISTTHRYMKNLYSSYMLTLDYIREVASSLDDLNQVQSGIAWRTIIMVLSSIHNLAMPNAPFSFSTAVQESRDYIKDSGFKESIALVDHSILTRKQKLSVWLVQHSLVEVLLGYYYLKYNKRGLFA
ncbi:MAG: glycosyltransferase [Syntrophomonadaceae bacterium]|jgi:glycosyltransferase EpsH|nr:glycosyltransferase [Syntrophomonadaceae bacterium]